MKKRVLSLLLSIVMAAGLTAAPVYAADTEPAPVKDSYEFDGVKYIRVGNNTFDSNQADYYKSMLTNPVGSFGYWSESEDMSEPSDEEYSIADLWSIAAMEMFMKNDADAFRNSLFRAEGDYFDAHKMRAVYTEAFTNKLGGSQTPVRETFNDDQWESNNIDFNFYKNALQSAANSQQFAKRVAREAASAVCGSNGEDLGIQDTIAVTVNPDKTPDLKGPVFYSLIGASGKDLHLFKGKPYDGNHFHGVVAAFSDFSITPIIPDENTEAPYAYVTTSIGTPTQDEQKTVSDVKNYSGETVTASQTISESTSSTVTSSINGSRSTSTTDGYSISDSVKVGAKFTLEKIFEFSEEYTSTATESHSVTDTVSSGWSSSEGTTKSQTESRTISISLPPYTTALMSQQHYNSEALVRYNCPAALNFKVTLYYAYGKLTGNDTEASISFEKLTEFGSSSDARADLAKRYGQSTGSSGMADPDGISWDYFRSEIKSTVEALSTSVPFDSTPATFSGTISSVKTEVEDILPIYPIYSIKFVNPDGVLYNKPWLSEISMEVGDIDNSNNYDVKALNQFGAAFYTFYKQNGKFILLDESGKDITETGNSVIKPDIDPVTKAVRFKAIGEGTAYLKYLINDGVYKTASMAATTTPEDYIDNDEIPNPAMLRINVTDTDHKHTWLKPKYIWSDDHSTCKAVTFCKYDDTHIKQETSDSVKTVLSKPTCTKAGVTSYTAEFETEGFEKQTKEVNTPATGHKYGNGKVTRKPTKTKAGIRTYTCSVCGDTKTETIPATGKVKAANPLKLKGKAVTVKYKKLRKKAQVLAAGKVIKFTKKASDKKTYKLVSAKKGKKNFKKYFKINSKTGKVRIKKGLKKGTYKVKIRVRALGNSKYKPSTWKPVTAKVKVK